MLRSIRTALVIFIVLTGTGADRPAFAAGVPLQAAKTIALPPATIGNFDHLALDERRNRTFVTAKDAHAVLVVDNHSGGLIATIRGLKRPHAVFYRADVDRLYVTDGGDGALRVFDGATYAPVARIALHADADSIGFDPSTKDLYIVNGGKDAGGTSSRLSIVDTTTLAHVADIPIASDTVEAMALDTYRPRLYVNDTAHNRVAVVDRWTRTVVAYWPLTLGQDNVAMALDEQHERLFVGCRSGNIVVLNSTTGREVQAIPAVRGIDDLTFDRSARRLYAAGNGAVSTYAQRDADHYVRLPTVQTHRGAVTALLVPQRSWYLTVFPRDAAHPAKLVRYKTATAWHDPAPPAIFAYAPNAPRAERLVMSTLSRHPFLRKLGLHGVAPGQHISALWANGNQTRLGIATTPGDFAAVLTGAFYGPLIADGSYYNVKLQLSDAARRRIGVIVMEIPASAAPNAASAERTAYAIRSEVSAQIPSVAALFAQ
jgi:hypothetical protein